MSRVPAHIAEQNAARIAAVGVSANEHIGAYQKALDYSYDLDRRLPSLAEALGVKQFIASEQEAAAEAALTEEST